MSILERIRRAGMLALDTATGFDTAPLYDQYLRLQYLPPRRLQELQLESLENLLAFARAHVPFYQARLQESPHVDLARLPIMTKQMLSAHRDELMSESVRKDFLRRGGAGSDLGWKTVSTGGSTGVPTTVIHDKVFRSDSRAGRMYAQGLCGFPFGRPYFRLWGSMREIQVMQDSVAARVQRALSGEVLYNAFRISEEDAERFIGSVNNSRINHIMAYTDAIDAVAMYAEAQKRWIRPVASVMACAGTLTSDTRKRIAKVFGARVHNKYGSRECGDIACECEDAGFHIFSNHAFVEIVDDAGRSLPPGQIGHVLVTLLKNFSFPLIRYDIGDMGAIAVGECECGRGWQMLDRLEGRSLQFLRAMNGSFISPIYVVHLIGVVHNPGFVRRFQLTQETDAEFVLKIVIAGDPGETEYRAFVDAVERDLRKVLGSQAVIGTERVEEILPSPSGKYFPTVNKLAGRGGRRG
jgi:phenylacetate-CoA ligase